MAGPQIKSNLVGLGNLAETYMKLKFRPNLGYVSRFWGFGNFETVGYVSDTFRIRFGKVSAKSAEAAELPRACRRGLGVTEQLSLLNKH